MKYSKLDKSKYPELIKLLELYEKHSGKSPEAIWDYSFKAVVASPEYYYATSNQVTDHTVTVLTETLQKWAKKTGAT